MPQDITAQGVGQQEKKDHLLNSGPLDLSAYKLCTSWKCLIRSKWQACLCHVCGVFLVVCVFLCIPLPFLPLDATYACLYVRSYITYLIQQLKLFLVDSCKNVVYDGKHHLKRARRDG